jgi:RimJ/RimL family protein N-acetyltransferase
MQVALGVVRGSELAAAFLFFNYRAGVDIEVTVVSDNADWCRPSTIRRLFDYPFRQLDLPRITSVVARDNKRCRKLCEGIGWKLEGVARKAYDGKKDAFIYGMLREEARFWKV